MANNLTVTSGGDEILTKTELAARLKLTTRTVQSYVDQRKIPFLRLSPRCLRFRLVDVLAKFEQGGGL